MLTQRDIEEIERIVQEIVHDEVKHLPNKEDFYSRMDELMGEVKAMRESQELHAGQHASISDFQEKVRTKVKRIEERLNLTR